MDFVNKLTIVGCMGLSLVLMSMDGRDHELWAAAAAIFGVFLMVYNKLCDLEEKIDGVKKD